VDAEHERRGLRERPHHADEVTAGTQRVTRALTVTFWAFLFWTALAVFFASQIFFLADEPKGWRLAVVAFAFSAPRWYSWGLLAPLVFWVDRRVGRGRSLASRVALHFPIGLTFTCVSIGLRLITRPLRGARWPPSLFEFFWDRFHWDVIIYAVMAGVSISRDYAAQVRERDRQAHALALQTADLEKRLVEARLQMLRAQVQPHFLFNALNTISAFTETNPRTARRLMEQLGDLLRASLTHASRPLVTLGEELTFLDDYLAIESARFEERMTVAVDADDAVLDALVPSFLLQPLVENAIHHGIAPRLSGGHLSVTARREGSRLELRVRDNGVGLASGWQFERDAGVGLTNVATRLEYLYSQRDLMKILPLDSGGVEVQLDLPLRRTASA
jgi:two-component system, LytTR family, sensor kinase